MYGSMPEALMAAERRIAVLEALLREAVENGMPYGASWFGQHEWTARVVAELEVRGGP